MKTIGQVLKNKREQQGMTLVELEQKTKIQRQILIMIEKNQFNDLPNPDYTKGFIRKYANTINLNGNELIEKHVTEIPRTATNALETINQLKQDKRSYTGITEQHLIHKLLVQLAIFFGACFIIWLLLIIII